MRRLAIALLLVAGCGGGDPTSFGLNVTVDAHSVPTGDLGRITTAKLTVTGAEEYQKSFDIASPIKSGEVRFRYIPRATTGQLTLSVDTLDASGAVLASGVSDVVSLVAGKAVAVHIVLGETSVDMGVVDGGDDGGATGDMAHVVKPQGAACTANAECASAGGCVDGYCCDTACTDGCKACNLAGKEGVCSPVAVGATPTAGHAGCGPDAQSSCQRDGKCDGAGACRKWALGTVCQAGTCNAGTNVVTSDSTCDGNGTCKPGTTITCAPYVCKDASVCWPSCTSGGSECSAGNVCTGNSCGKKALGTACSSSTECQNGSDGSAHCVDGVCCDVPCAGTCQYCALSASKGTCSLVPANSDPRVVCPAGANTICTPGGCTGTTMACKIAAQNTPCSASCSSNTPSNTTCNATGTCNQTTNGSACSAYLCVLGGGGTQATCTTTCNSDADCDQPNYGCNLTSHQCGLVNGKGCSSGTDCQSGACAPEGICCNTACTGQCQYCDSTGTCQLATGAAHAPRANCTSDATYPVCSGTCNGTSPSCSYPTFGCQACYPPGPNVFGYTLCTGPCSNGTCNASCTTCSAGYQCGRSPFTGNYVCFNSCSAANQGTNCAPGYTCINGTCQ